MSGWRRANLTAIKIATAALPLSVWKKKSEPHSCQARFPLAILPLYLESVSHFHMPPCLLTFLTRVFCAPVSPATVSVSHFLVAKVRLRWGSLGRRHALFLPGFTLLWGKRLSNMNAVPYLQLALKQTFCSYLWSCWWMEEAGQCGWVLHTQQCPP